jgi:hypothetical protein
MIQAPPLHFPYLDDELPIHPYSLIFPAIPDHGIELLAESIESNGQLYPVVLYQDAILDGKNRYKAISLINCRRTMNKQRLLSLKYGRFMYGESGSNIDLLALKFVEATNLYRRNLTPPHQDAIASFAQKFLDAIAQKERNLCSTSNR